MKDLILLIDDEKLMRVTLEDALVSAGYDVLSLESGIKALNAFRENTVSAVVTDIRLPDLNGIEILREVLREEADAQVIMMTGYGTVESAVEAMKIGAFDYLTKPFVLEEFLLTVNRALEVRNLSSENLRLRKDLCRGRISSLGIVGESEALTRVLSLVERLASSGSTVLILGESGTGKEMVAQAIHRQSMRSEKPLIKVNCAALTGSLIESELFGHEKGAFTDAIRMKPGRFEMADGGTLFFDEIGDIPLSTQVKMLRVLQEMQFERLGGTESLTVDVRIVAATNKDLEKEVKEGRFREDLYYRLNVIPVTLPPLRDRREDIPALAELFLNRHRVNMGRELSLAEETLKALIDYQYPGNVRELENIIERCASLATSDIIQEIDLPPYLLRAGKKMKSFLLSEISARAEKEHIIRSLKATGGNKTQAAELLGISRKTLWEKLNIYGK